MEPEPKVPPAPRNVGLRPRQGSQKITTTFHEMPGRPINSITPPQSRRSTALRLRRVVAMLLVLGGSDVCVGRFGAGGRAARGARTPTKNSAHGSAGSMCHNAQCYEYADLACERLRGRKTSIFSANEVIFLFRRYKTGSVSTGRGLRSI